jgi:hypothetical protein
LSTHIDHYSLSRLLLITPSVMVSGAIIGTGMAWLLGDLHLAPKIAGVVGGALSTMAFFFNQMKHGPIITDDNGEI